MAILHRATLVPSKLELIEAWLVDKPWAPGDGPLELVGSFRFDDPDGEVGIECLLVARAHEVLHVALTYRAAPLAAAHGVLVGTMEHSALGTRWVYDGITDPVAVSAIIRAVCGLQDQARLEVWDGDALVERKESPVRVRAVGSSPRGASVHELVRLPHRVISDGRIAEIAVGEARLRLVRVVGGGVPGDARLTATWPGGEADLASLV